MPGWGTVDTHNLVLRLTVSGVINPLQQMPSWHASKHADNFTHGLNSSCLFLKTTMKNMVKILVVTLTFDN
jgi:hypothetical protein